MLLVLLLQQSMGQQQFKKGGFILALTLKVQTMMAGKSREQELEGDSSTTSRVKKLRGTEAISQLAFFHSGCYSGSS